MYCPFCGYNDSRVIDSRLVDDGATVRRRRQCPSCGVRFNTFETAEIKMPVVIKSNQCRQPFDEERLKTSFDRALQKRPVDSEAVDAAVRNIINQLQRSGDREVPALRIGELVMDELKQLDHVAYVRFASVYRKFEDVEAFQVEIDRLRHDGN